jgi:hypothetical protein
MLAASRADLSEAFCSYCGYPPMGPWRLRAHRVCMRCQMGVILRALPNAQPRFDEPFLIVDERLIVQAISHRAELLLMVNEPDGFGVHLEEFLVSANGDADGLALALMAEQAIAGDATPGSLELRTVRDRAICHVGRVVGCRPPPAALVILGAPKPDVQRSSNGLRPGAAKRRLPVYAAGGGGG